MVPRVLFDPSNFLGVASNTNSDGNSNGNGSGNGNGTGNSSSHRTSNSNMSNMYSGSAGRVATLQPRYTQLMGLFQLFVFGPPTLLIVPQTGLLCDAPTNCKH